MPMYFMQRVAGSVIFDLSVNWEHHSFLPYFMSFTFQLLDFAGPAACVLPARHRRELSGPNCQNGQSNSVYASHKRRQYSQPATPTASFQHRH